MKKNLLFISFLTLVGFKSLAQDTPDDFYNRVSYVFQHVDNSPVSTGLLLDCGVEFMNLGNFDGLALTDSNYVSLLDWRCNYATLLSSQFNGNISFTDFPTINSRISTATATNLPIPFVLLHYNYQVLRDDALSSGLMYSSNDQLYDVANRPASPYLNKTAFAISPALNYYKTTDGYVSFIFKSDLMFGNTGKTISTLKVNFDNGNGLQSLTTGMAYSAQYSSSGYKTLTYQITYTDNSVYTGHSKIYIDYQNESYTPGGGDFAKYFYPIADHPITVNVNGVAKHANLEIRLSNSNTAGTIQKPLIVVEGIDFWKITSPTDNTNNYRVRNFLNSVTLTNLFPNSNLNNEIDIKGYDIVFIDFDEATDYMENNSALVQSAITYVNGVKTTTNPNVVLGLSMGGVIARHALRTMEINSIPHDTRLFINMDGPQQGANFPLGLQAIAKHISTARFKIFNATLINFSDAFEGIGTAYQILETPAVKQLLIYRYDDPYILNIDNSIHDNFYSNLRNNLGYPTQTRNVSISNGSECGIGQNFAPYTTIFERNEVDKGGYLPYVVDVITSPLQFVGGLFTSNPFVGFGATLGFLSFHNNIITEFEVKALPDHQAQRIYKGRIAIQRKILGFINVNSNLTNKSAYSTSSMLPLDNAPGGQVDFRNADTFGIGGDFADLVQVNGFGYIPTVSALDIGSGNTTITTAKLTEAYSRDNPPASPFNTPFTNFVTASPNANPLRANEDHYTFTARNGEFILKELDQTTTGFSSCAIFCNTSNLIQGPTQFCTPQNYQIDNLPTGSTVSWSISPSSGIASLSTSGNTATLTKTGNGSVSLSATVNSTCGAISIGPLTIRVGVPDRPKAYDELGNTITSVQTCVDVHKDINLSLPSNDEILEYEWEKVNGAFNLITFGSSATVIGFTPSFGLVSVRARNSCGWSMLTFFSVQVQNCGSFSETPVLNVYPNPSNTYLTIEYLPGADSSKSMAAPASKNIELLNGKGEIVKAGKLEKGKSKIILDTSELPDGTYYLHIKDGKETIKKQVIIKHY